MNDIAVQIMGTARIILPELIVLVCASLMVLWASFWSVATPVAARRAKAMSVWGAVLILLAAAAVYFAWPADVAIDAARVPFVSDHFTQVLRPAGLLFGLILVLLTAEQLHHR